MNKNIKGIIVIVVVLIIIAAIYFAVKKFMGKSKFKEGYSKNPGEWVGCKVEDYNKDYYSAVNTSGVTIYVKKSEVNTRPGKTADAGLCADAKTKLTVKYLE